MKFSKNRFSVFRKNRFPFFSVSVLSTLVNSFNQLGAELTHLEHTTTLVTSTMQRERTASIQPGPQQPTTTYFITSGNAPLVMLGLCIGLDEVPPPTSYIFHCDHEHHSDNVSLTRPGSRRIQPLGSLSHPPNVTLPSGNTVHEPIASASRAPRSQATLHQNH